MSFPPGYPPAPPNFDDPSPTSKYDNPYSDELPPVPSYTSQPMMHNTTQTPSTSQFTSGQQPMSQNINQPMVNNVAQTPSTSQLTSQSGQQPISQPTEQPVVNKVTQTPSTSQFTSQSGQQPMSQTDGELTLQITGNPSQTSWVTTQNVPPGYQNASVPGTPQNGEILKIEPYTERSFIVRGDTKPYYTPLKMMGGNWIRAPRDQKEPGWCFGNYNLQKVSEYITQVNQGTAEAPPTYAVQNVNWTVFKPEPGMKLKITIPAGQTEYDVSDVEKDGWVVTKATIFCPRDPKSIHQMVITNGKWQIFGYTEQHTIEPIS